MGNTLDSKLCQFMLFEHGVFPSEVVNRPLKEKQLMWQLILKQGREIQEIRDRGRRSWV